MDRAEFLPLIYLIVGLLLAEVFYVWFVYVRKLAKNLRGRCAGAWQHLEQYVQLRRPWCDVVEALNLQSPPSLERVRGNLSYLHVNYVLVLAMFLGLDFCSRPIDTLSKFFFWMSLISVVVFIEDRPSIPPNPIAMTDSSKLGLVILAVCTLLIRVLAAGDGLLLGATLIFIHSAVYKECRTNAQVAMVHVDVPARAESRPR